MKESLRAKIERAANRRAASLNAEIVDRLEQSFVKEDAKFDELGGEGIYRFMKVLAAVIGLMEHKTGQTFGEDPNTRAQAIIALGRLLEGYKIEALGEASELGKGVLYGDQSVGKEIGDQLRIQVLTEAIDRAKSSLSPDADK